MKRMKGQATLEYLLILGATIVLISLLATSLFTERVVLEGKAEKLKAATTAESAARAIECMLNSGGGMSFDFRREGVYYSVENGHFHAQYGDKLIEVDGVFHDDRTEPV